MVDGHPLPTKEPPLIISGPHPRCGPIAEPILRALPGWFGIEEAIVEYVTAIDRLETFLAEEGDETVGFMTLERRFERAAELHVLAVVPTHHRRGIGRALLDATETYSRGVGIEFLQVKTLSPARESEEYGKTRRFYEASGFVPLEEFPTLWGPANPALQMIKSLKTGGWVDAPGGTR